MTNVRQAGKQVDARRSQRRERSHRPSRRRFPVESTLEVAQQHVLQCVFEQADILIRFHQPLHVGAEVAVLARRKLPQRRKRNLSERQP